MSFSNRIISYLTNPRNLRQVILIATGLLVLGVAVLFGDEIEKLLNPPKPSAAYNKPDDANLAWSRLTNDMTKARSLGKLVEVNTGGKRYIYAIGGIEHNTSDNNFRSLDSVERMEISTTDGSPVTGVWEGGVSSLEPWSTMFSGHAAFQAFQHGNYLYVVSGDAHIPDPAALETGSSPLLFSTIERLNLSSPTADWEVWAKLTGVNFYPETIITGSSLHIIGGIYGLPFVGGREYSWGGYNLRQPIYGDEDVAKWDTYKNTPTVGKVGTGTTGVSLPTGAIGTAVATGAQVIVNEPSTGTSELSGSTSSLSAQQVQIQQVTPINLAKQLSEYLMKGQFSTTVSEHYILNLNASGNAIKVFEGELGVNPGATSVSDYAGQRLSEAWATGKVAHLAHLRFYVGYWPGTTAISISPVTQGRYGFSLFKHPNGSLMVTGGATWFSPASTAYMTNQGRSFWVIEDDLGPFPLIGGGWPQTKAYQYVGNITYAYHWDLGSATHNHWLGTNSKSETVTAPSGMSPTLPAGYTLADSLGVAQGRAFMGLGFLDTASTVDSGVRQTTPLIVGGIINSPAWTPPSSLSRLPLQLAGTARTDRLGETGWVADANLDMSGVDINNARSIYGLHVTGLNDRAVVFDGQTEMDDGTYANPRVPDYAQSGSNSVAMLSGGQWYSMLKFGDSDNDGNVRGVPGLIFSADLDVRTAREDGGTTVYVYKAGGSTVQSDNWPSNSRAVQILGPFIYGQGGTPDESASELVIEPDTIAGDGKAYAVATVTMRDYSGAPLEGVNVSIFQSGSSQSSPVEVKFEELYGLDPGSPLNNDEQNGEILKTGANGIVKFKLSSEGVGSALINTCVVVLIGDGVACEPPSLGPVNINFVKPNVPWNTTSTIEAAPTQVPANGTDISTITVMLNDGQDSPAPVEGYKVRIMSNRNYVEDSDDYSGDTDIISTISDITDEAGQATFAVSSEAAGIASFWAEYLILEGDDTQPDGYWVRLSDIASVQFMGMITNIVPNHGTQGANINRVTISGSQTKWNSSTTVELIEPQDIVFYVPPLDGRTDNGMGTLRLVAGGSAQGLGVWIPDPEYANKTVEIKIIDGGGGLRPAETNDDYADTITVSINNSGRAEFEYLPPDDYGILKLRAQVKSVTNPPSYTLWQIIEQSDNPYVMEITTDPRSVDISSSPLGESAVTARIFRYNNGQKITVPASLEFSFATDAGSVTPTEDISDAGFAHSVYRPDTVPGGAKIFASAQYNDFWVAGWISIIKEGDDSGITIDQTDIVNFGSIVLGGTISDDKFFRIGNTAKVGPWTIRITTPEDTEEGLSYAIPLIEEGTFTVEATNSPTAETITIEPRSGWRGDTMELAITGYGTSFDDLGIDLKTELHFIPPKDGDAAQITVDSLEVLSATSATATIAIDHNAKIGYWNVEAITGDERAAMTGEKDFAVSDEHNYILDINGADRVARDGETPVPLTIYVGKFDPISGNPTSLDGVVVTLNKGDDAGTLKPVNDSGVTQVTTQDGNATATYTPDVGDVNEDVTIVATATMLDGTPLIKSHTITKEALSYTGFIVWAEPDELALTPATASALLGFAGLPENTVVDFHLEDSPAGHLENEPTAVSKHARYIVGNNAIAETVRFWGTATIPGYGLVKSNISTIDVGLDPTKYRLTMLSPNPETVEAGGGTSTITAQLKFNGNNVNGWPIEFTIEGGTFGDDITDTLVKTVNGQAVTTFVAGPFTGNVIIKATAVGLDLVKGVVVTKEAEQDIDPARSSIQATPTHVPVDATGAKYSLVTVLLRNSNDVPLKGLSVKLTSNRSNDTIKQGDGSNGDTVVTNNSGRARFRVSSSSAGTSTISATVGSRTFGTQIFFESSGLITQYLRVRVPFEARDYDNEVLTYIKKNGSTSDSDVCINGYYTKNARPNDELAELNNEAIYLKPNTTYFIWVKGRYHLARSATFITGSTNMTATDSPIAINVTELLIGDVAPNFRKVGEAEVALPFRDNAINTVDVAPLYAAWFTNVDLLDFYRDYSVNGVDWLYWFTNYGLGELGGPPPYDQRL
ncbi:MAG: hypothetical protein WC400_00850 [Patescibacteria group bacterium]|jgi:hypothetical protein